MKLRNVFSIATFCLLAGASTVASAAAVFQLTSDHCTGNCLGGTAGTSAGTVTVTASGNSLIFNVVMNAGFNLINTGFPLTFGFDLAGTPTITYSGLTAGFGVPNGFGAGNLQQSAGVYHQDGVGDFQYGVLWGTQGGGSGTAGPLNFTITGAAPLHLTTNAQAQFFAVDVLSPNGRTGNVDASVCTGCGDIPLPEPTPLALVAIGILALVGTRKWAARAK